ncbi:MAG: hypothetical protein AB1609_21495, partial [Bacillota bacterium]
KTSAVVVSEHAKLRWRERGGQGPLRPGRIRHHLLATLHVGAEAGPECQVEVGLAPGWRAVCVPQAQGGWLVVTVIREEEAC